MRFVLDCDLSESTGPWDQGLLQSRIAGLTLLERHLLGFQRAGVDRVELCGAPDDGELDRLLEGCRIDGLSLVRCDARPENGEVIVQRADTLIDPRLLSRLVAESSASDGFSDQGNAKRSIVFLDRYRENYPSDRKSTFRFGVPEQQDVQELSSVERSGNGFYPIGLGYHSAQTGQPDLALEVGRFYWHRVRHSGDAKEATRKVLLSTMKATDGFYAKLNRRMSLLISRLLVGTPVTANLVTLTTLLFGVAAAGLYAVGTYGAMVGGAFLAWFASMLDGVDGELARARFEESDFGCWLEMVCDYLFYIVLFPGMGWGLYQSTGSPVWWWMGLGSSLGTVVSFAVIARQRKRYAEVGSASDFGHAFHETVVSEKSPLMRFIRNSKFIANRAASPYYFFILTVLGLVKFMLIVIFLGTVLTPILTPYASSFMRGADPPSER